MSCTYGAGLQNKSIFYDLTDESAMKNKKTFRVSEDSALFTKDSPVYDMVQNMVHNFESDISSHVSDEKTSAVDVLDWCDSVLALSPNGLALLEEFENEGWVVNISADMGETDFSVDHDAKVVQLNGYGVSPDALPDSDYFRHCVLVSYLHALRDVWQEKRTSGVERNYKPEDLMLMERVRSADLDVMAVLVAWELRNEGYGAIWRHMIGGEDGDVALAFSQCLERKKLQVSSGESFSRDALIAAFNQWFVSDERVNTADRTALDYIDEILGTSIDANPLGDEVLSPARLEVLSTMPNKSAYLRGMGMEILRDPVYAGLKDAINQSHLLHIAYDLRVTYRGGVPFRNADLAAKIFPQCSEAVH